MFSAFSLSSISSYSSDSSVVIQVHQNRNIRYCHNRYQALGPNPPRATDATIQSPIGKKRKPHANNAREPKPLEKIKIVPDNKTVNPTERPTESLTLSTFRAFRANCNSSANSFAWSSRMLWSRVSTMAETCSRFSPQTPQVISSSGLIDLQAGHFFNSF